MAYSVAGDELDDSLESSMEKGQAALESYRKDLGLSTLHAQPLGNAAHGASSSDGVPCTQTGKKLVESGFRKKRQPRMYVRAPQTSRSRGTCRQLAMPSMLDAPRLPAVRGSASRASPLCCVSVIGNIEPTEDPVAPTA